MRSTTTNPDDPNAPDYYAGWVSADIPKAIAVAEDYVDNYLNNDPTSQYPWDLEGVLVGVGTELYAPTNQFIRKFHNIPVIYASQVGYCY